MKSKITVNYKTDEIEEAVVKLEKMIEMIKNCDALTKVEIKCIIVENDKGNY